MIRVDSLKKHKIKVITIGLYALTLIFNQNIFINSVKTTGGYLLEMVQILPAVFILSGLITVWIPKELVIKSFGKTSGMKGKIISLFIGSISAGPIYAAFPVAFSLLSKGASISNIVIIISSWAVVKIPMLIVESKFLGFNFMLIRTLLTIPAILAIGYVVKIFIDEKKVIGRFNTNSMSNVLLKIENILPSYNCGGCGYESCKQYAEAIITNNDDKGKCSVGGAELKEKIENIIKKEQGGLEHGNN